MKLVIQFDPDWSHAAWDQSLIWIKVELLPIMLSHELLLEALLRIEHP